MKMEFDLTPESLAEMCKGGACPRQAVNQFIIPMRRFASFGDGELSIVDKIRESQIHCNPFRGDCQRMTAAQWEQALDKQ